MNPHPTLSTPTLIDTIIQSRWVYCLAVLAGLLQAFAFDIPFDAPITWGSAVFSFASLCLFLFVLSRLPAQRGGKFGYLFGLSYFGWGLNWIYISMASFGGAPLIFAILANIAVIAYLSLYWLLAGYLIPKIGRSVNQRLLIAAAFIVILEWVRAHFLIGFPWLSIGYAWVDTPLAVIASVGGVLSVSFFVLLLAAIVLLKWSIRYKAVLCAILLLGIIPVSVLVKPAPATPKTPAINVALVQGNMPVITKYNPQRMDQNLVQYEGLTENILKQNKPVDLVVWPESSIPYFHIDARPFLQKIKTEKQQINNFDLITGIPKFNPANNSIYNAILLQKRGNNEQFYYKQHLLPFGEYLPFRSVLSFFEDFVSIPMSDFSRGELIQPTFNVGDARFSPSICFEVVFGNEIRHNALNANVLLNISNDAWFGRSKAQLQHLNIARMRAIENQKPMIRATNNGLTAIIASSGHVTHSLAPFTADVLTAPVAPVNIQTPYARYGDGPWVIFFVIFFLVALITPHCLPPRS